MLEFLAKLLDTQDFPARWHCGNWTPGHGWLHIISDSVIFGCYLAIPIVLIYFRRKRRDIPFPMAFTLFSIFILSCGIGHLLEAVIFYDPVYRLSGVVKAVTASASVATLAYIVPLMPKVFALRSPSEMEKEVEQRRSVEQQLRQLQKELEAQVEERSRELVEERERLKEALAKSSESERLLNAALNAAPNAMAMIDSRGQPALFNSAFCELFGYSQEDAHRLRVEDLMSSKQRDQHLLERERYLAQPEKRPMGQERLLYGMHSSGRSIPLEIGLNPMEFGGRQYTLVSIVDISERVKAREELLARERHLERANEELRDFVYVASHDLQEPLRKVSSFCQLLERELEGKLDDRTKEYLFYAVDGAQRMQQLIKDLLNYSRIAHEDHDWSSLSTEAVVQEVLAELSVAIEESSANIEIQDLPTVSVPAPLLHQVFTNLISNALKYRHKERPAQIHISASKKATEVQFTIADNGVGVPEKHREKVFGVFQRLHRRQEYAGTGIGLAIVKKAVERWGGRVWIEDSSLGGIAVIFTVPIPSVI